MTNISHSCQLHSSRVANQLKVISEQALTYFLKKKLTKSEETQLLTCTFMVPVGSSVLLELVLAVHSYHVIAYPADTSTQRHFACHYYFHFFIRMVNKLPLTQDTSR